MKYTIRRLCIFRDIKGRLLTILKAIALLPVLASCDLKPEKKPTPVAYQVLKLSPQQADTYFDHPATIQGQQIIEIRPKVDGFVQAIYVNEGATVKKGQLLFKISNPQYEQAMVTANAAIRIAEADVSTAKMNVEKVKPLVQKEIISEYELKSDEFALQSKQAVLAQARATLANAEANLGYTILRSPADGVIGMIPYKIGALVNSTTTQPLTTVSNTKEVYAYFSWNEVSMLRFLDQLPGHTLEERLSQIPPVILLLADGRKFPEAGKLQTASGLISTETGAETFKAVFPNPNGMLRSGASAVVRIPKHRDSALLVPQSASYELQNKHFVYKLSNDNKIISTAVEVTPTTDGQLFIVSKGLVSGDRVVLNGFNLKDSIAIKPILVEPDSVYANFYHRTQP
jgi:membrane fusion protein (multidrug efflux system)